MATQYVIQAGNGRRWVLVEYATLGWLWWTPLKERATRFPSMTEAALFITRADLEDVQIVPVAQDEPADDDEDDDALPYPPGIPLDTPLPPLPDPAGDDDLPDTDVLPPDWRPEGVDEPDFGGDEVWSPDDLIVPLRPPYDGGADLGDPVG